MIQTSQTSQTFRNNLRNTLNEFAELQAQLDARLDKAVLELTSTEEQRLVNETECPNPVGTRVLCPAFNREGVITEANIVVRKQNSGYDAPRYGYEQYEVYNPEYQETAYWEYTIETDPSPTRGCVSTYTTTAVIRA